MTEIVNTTVEKGWSGFWKPDGNGKQLKTTQSKLDLSEYSEPRVGDTKYDNTTHITEVYKGNGVWEEQDELTYEGEDFDDIPY